MHARGPTPEWYVISLRPRGAHGAVRRAAARHGAGLLALSPWVLRLRDDSATRAALAQALDAPRIVFTSPVAVRAADALHGLEDVPAREWIAVGAGTAAALRRAGVSPVHAPGRMDSEGLLALPVLQDIAGTAVGLVSAPDGRDVLAPAFRSRGARVRRADVYVRDPVPPSPRAVDALLGLRAPAVLLLSSGAALAEVLRAMPPAACATLRDVPVVAASDRLLALASAEGFRKVARAAGPRPGQLVAAAGAVAAHRPA